MSLSVTGLFRYPVKSCSPESLAESVVEPWGLAGDRRWMVATPDGAMVSARERPELLRVGVALAEDGTVTLSADGAGSVTVGVPAPDPSAPVHIWGTDVLGTPAGPEARAWVSRYLDDDVLLLHADDPSRRQVDERYAAPGDSVTFADGYPLHLTSEASLTALNHLIADGPRAQTEWPLPMGRFRANLVVDGEQAWVEDSWRRIRVGDAAFRLVKGCARCVMTTTDAPTGEIGREPLATLVRHRRWDGLSWFGMNLVPDTPGATIRVGDPVDVLEVDEDAVGPPR